MDDLRSATAIVTGASRGIGVYIARSLAKAGVNLALAARSADELADVRREMQGLGVGAIDIPCDVAKDSDRAVLIGRTEAEFGAIDILVNNAGIERVARFDQTPESDLVETLAVNLEAPMMLTRALIPGMLARNRGHIVNIASGAGKVGIPYESAYSASKHGLVGFTSALRAEYRGSSVGFSVVCPGFVTDTGMYNRWYKQGNRAPKIAGSSKPEKVADVTLQCIKHNRAEVIVNTPPIRPMIVLANVIPSIAPWLLQRLGYTQVFERALHLDTRPNLTHPD